VQSVGQLVHFGASEVLGWARCASHEKRIGEQYTKLVFLHLVRSVGHIVCSGASEVQNVNALFFMLGWADVDLEKVRPDTLRRTYVFSSGAIYGSRSAFWGVRGMKHLFFMIEWAQCGLEKTRLVPLHRTCVFTSSLICGSHIVFWGVRRPKCRSTIFHAWVGPVWIP
jgi:hypothetical protein